MASRHAPHMRRWLTRLRASGGSRGHLGLRREWWIFSALLLATCWWLAGPQQLERSNLLVQDLASRLQQRPASPEVVVIAIDDRSIEAIGRWPWRRAIHAQLVRHLSAQNPKAIGLDVLFSEEDLDYPTDDALLASAIADSGRVVLPVAQDLAGRPVGQLPALIRAAATLGHVQLRVDADGGVRSFAPRAGLAGQSHLHLGLAMRCVALPQDALCAPQPADTPPALQYIGFAGGNPAFTTYSYIDVVRGAIPASAFRGKYVVVGSLATGLSAAVATPTQTAQHTPNVVMVAQILNGALQHTHAVPASATANRLFNALPLLLTLLALALLGPSAALAACVLLWSATLLTATLAPLWWQLVLTPAAALLLVALAYPLWSWRRLNAAARFLEHEMRDLGRSGVLAPLQSGLMGHDMLAQRIQAVEQASRQLRALHHFVSESLLQLPSPTLVCDPQGRILLANSAAQRYAQSLGQTLQERQDVQLLLAGARENDSQGPLFDPQTLAGGQASFQHEGIDRLGNHLLLVGRPFAAPPTTGWLLTLVDITHMRQAMAQRDQAMHFISHDIRAPIGAIVTLLEMDRTFGHRTTDTAGPLVSSDTEVRIERYARSALALADDFVHLARAQQQPPRQEAVELGQLLEQAVDDSWAAAHAKLIDIDWMPQDAEALVTGDPGQLRRVLGNLLGNAIKYSPAGSTVHCSIAERPAHWVVVLRDEGDGISPEQQATLFQPFTRLAQHEASRIQGVGLGLAFVHTVMQRHGAVMELDSTPGQGCTFRLVFAKR
ncbi:CHASE2 domain-containing protein [Comamonas sp. UBA7528]|uniref:CHASE2 domain-containing protein n=1 Tax=Comamonas sp. UBA7528 TaxID=1946391 RepID=UPI0025C23BEA|nr:CHASE2 domain-containing protein [Comamonas sp. UBA7528]